MRKITALIVSAASIATLSTSLVAASASERDASIASLLPSSRTFDAPDDTEPYTCTFHWFRLPDGRLAGLDVIRSDDTGRLGLRVFTADLDGKVRAIVHEAPKGEWRSRFTGKKPTLAEVIGRPGDAPFVGRGTGWVAGSVDGVAFTLSVAPQTRSRGLRWLSRALVHMTAVDFESVRTTGEWSVDGSIVNVDSLGTASVHAGDFLPTYAYISTVPQLSDGAKATNVLISGVGPDDFRLPAAGFTYSYGRNGVPALDFSFKAFTTEAANDGGARDVVVGNTTVRLRDVKRFDHELLGVATTSATAMASLVDSRTGAESPLGQVIIDVRGDDFVTQLG